MSVDSKARLADWSVKLYGLLLHVYPTAFHREYGEPMLQVFRDQARAACVTHGIAGLGMLWVRTIGDLIGSVADAYLVERSRITVKVFLGVGVLYVCTLSAAVGYGALRFGEFYAAPAFSRDGGDAVDEEALIAARQDALRGEFGTYQSFARAGMVAVGTLLALGAGLFGLCQKSVVRGALAGVLPFATVGWALVTAVGHVALRLPVTGHTSG